MPLNAKNENWEFHKRFFLKVEIGKPNDCWPFVAGKLKSGYGQLHVGKKNIRAHRFAWSMANGDLADDLVVCHKCDNKECCNPNHLFVGTQKDNMADYSQKVQSGRAKRKPSGPNLKGENTL